MFAIILQTVGQVRWELFFYTRIHSPLLTHILRQFKYHVYCEIVGNAFNGSTILFLTLCILKKRTYEGKQTAKQCMLQ